MPFQFKQYVQALCLTWHCIGRVSRLAGLGGF